MGAEETAAKQPVAKKRGRPKGSENRNKRAMRQLLQSKYPGYEPVMEMAKAAMEATAIALENKQLGNNDIELWMQVVEAHNKVAKYVTPQLAAVKVEAEINNGQGGVLLVPGSPTSLEDWVNQAKIVQQKQEEHIIEHIDE